MTLTAPENAKKLQIAETTAKALHQLTPALVG